MAVKKPNASNAEVSVLDLHLSILNEFLSSKIYDKRDNFDFNIEIYHFYTVMSPASLLMVFASLNLFALLGWLVIWLISMIAIKA